MKYVIEFDFGPALDVFDEYQRKRILHSIFGQLHDVYMDARVDMGNYSDIFSMFTDSEGWNEPDADAAVVAHKYIEEQIENQFGEECAKNDA